MVNKLSKNNDYLTKSKITAFYNSDEIYKKVPKQIFLTAFDKCKGTTEKVGILGDATRQKTVKYVKKEDLLKQVVDDFRVYFHRNRK